MPGTLPRAPGWTGEYLSRESGESRFGGRIVNVVFGVSICDVAWPSLNGACTCRPGRRAWVVGKVLGSHRSVTPVALSL